MRAERERTPAKQRGKKNGKWRRPQGQSTGPMLQRRGGGSENLEEEKTLKGGRQPFLGDKGASRKGWFPEARGNSKGERSGDSWGIPSRRSVSGPGKLYYALQRNKSALFKVTLGREKE